MIQKNQVQETDDSIVDVLTQLDGSWNSREWIASKGIVFAITENSAQVLHISCKARIFPQYAQMNEKKKNGP